MSRPVAAGAVDNLFILEKGKPVVRRGRKAMGPQAGSSKGLGVARLPKG